MAVSFTLVDLKFLVKQSFSLTLQPPRPTLAKVNKTYKQYRHYNAFVIVLPVRNISMMKLLLSCSSRRQDPRRHRKILPARGTACIFSPLSPIVTTGCFTFHLFGTPNQSYTHFFKNTFTFIYFYLVMYLQPVVTEGAYKIEVQLAYLVNFAQCLLRFARHFTLLHSKLVFHSLESLFTRV